MPIVAPHDSDHPGSASPMDILVMVVLAIVGVGGVVDLILDQPESWYSAHVLLELGLVATSLILATSLWLRWRSLTTELVRTRRSLADRQAERDAWQASAEGALRSMAEAVGVQLSKWELTPTEREVALLLLQGLGHKEIAARTGRSERTVRQHAVSVYDKSGQSGRAELAGFFLHGIGGGEVNGER